MLLMSILVLSIVIQFCAAGMALLLIRKSYRSIAWVFLAAAFVLMGIRRGISLENALASDTVVLDPTSESLGLLISFLLLAGVWLIRGVFDYLTQLRLQGVRGNPWLELGAAGLGAAAGAMSSSGWGQESLAGIQAGAKAKADFGNANRQLASSYSGRIADLMAVRAQQKSMTNWGY